MHAFECHCGRVTETEFSASRREWGYTGYGSGSIDAALGHRYLVPGPMS